MFAALLLDHRLALLLLSAPVIGPAVPLAFAWARVLPEDPPPFAEVGSSSLRPKNRRLSDEAGVGKRDPVAIALLLCVTFSYVLQLPGLNTHLGLGTLPKVIPQDTIGWLNFGLTWFFVAVPGFAVFYALLRPNFLRIPLIAAGVLVLLLWLLAAPLHAALTAVS